MSETDNIASAGPACCLLVEADPFSATRLREIMQQAFYGIVPHHASNQPQARVMFASVRPQVVVVGTNLADGGLIADMTQSASNVCVLVCAGHVADDRIFPALRAGAAGYLLKHNGAEAIVAEIRRIVAGTPSLSPGLARQFLRHFSALGKLETLDEDEYCVLDGIASGVTLPALGTRLGGAVEERVRRVYEKLSRSSRR